MQEPTGFETEQEIAALKKVVWQGRCRKESNTSVRTFYGSDHVLKSDYRVQLGSLVGGKLPGDEDAAPDGRYGEECGAVTDVPKSGMFVDVYERDLAGEWDKAVANGVPSASHGSSSSDEGIAPSCTLRLNDTYKGGLGTTLYCDEYKT